MSDQHTIQLRGPWRVTALAADSVAVFEDRINVRETADWSTWISRVADAESVKSISWRRKFNWPATGQRPSSVGLVIAGPTPDRIELNGETLNPGFADGVSRVEVLSRLTASNRLLIEYHLVDLADSSACPELAKRSPVSVCLQISE